MIIYVIIAQRILQCDGLARECAAAVYMRDDAGAARIGMGGGLFFSVGRSKDDYDEWRISIIKWSLRSERTRKRAKETAAADPAERGTAAVTVAAAV